MPLPLVTSSPLRWGCVQRLGRWDHNSDGKRRTTEDDLYEDDYGNCDRTAIQAATL